MIEALNMDEAVPGRVKSMLVALILVPTALPLNNRAQTRCKYSAVTIRPCTVCSSESTSSAVMLIKVW